jgi:hypothetical protein
MTEITIQGYLALCFLSYWLYEAGDLEMEYQDKPLPRWQAAAAWPLTWALIILAVWNTYKQNKL